MTKIARTLAPLALLLASLPGAFPAAAQFADQATYVATPGGTANAITLAVNNWSRNLPGVVIRFVPTARNTGAVTVVVNGVGSPVAVGKSSANGLAPLSGGEIAPGQVAEISFNGTQWQIMNPATPQNFQVPNPGGYLTPCDQTTTPISGCTAGVLLPTADLNASTLFYAPVTGAQVPIYNGAQMVATPFSQLSLVLTSGQNAINTIYDVCVTTATAGAYAVTGSPTLVTGPPWSNSSAGSGSRGTGAGTAELVRVSGVYVNAQAFDGHNSTTTISSIPANRCTYLGSVAIGGIAGQVTLNRSYGQSRRWDVWNAYNRLPLYLAAGDPTASWNYLSATIRPSNDNPANSLRVFSGLAEESYDLRFIQRIKPWGNSFFSTTLANIGIGFNSTTAISGTRGQVSFSGGSSANQATDLGAVAQFTAPPSLGANVVTALEATPAQAVASPSAEYFGTQTYMLLSAFWRG